MPVYMFALAMAMAVGWGGLGWVGLCWVGLGLDGLIARYGRSEYYWAVSGLIGQLVS